MWTFAARDLQIKLRDWPTDFDAQWSIEMPMLIHCELQGWHMPIHRKINRYDHFSFNVFGTKIDRKMVSSSAPSFRRRISLVGTPMFVAASVPFYFFIFCYRTFIWASLTTMTIIKIWNFKIYFHSWNFKTNYRITQKLPNQQNSQPLKSQWQWSYFTFFF